MADQPKVLRKVFPIKSTCPDCGSAEYRHAGSSRGGTLRYRTCLQCRETYRVPPIGEEIDRGGMQSEVRIW